MVTYIYLVTYIFGHIHIWSHVFAFLRFPSFLIFIEWIFLLYRVECVVNRYLQKWKYHSLTSPVSFPWSLILEECVHVLLASLHRPQPDINIPRMVCFLKKDFYNFKPPKSWTDEVKFIKNSSMDSDALLWVLVLINDVISCHIVRTINHSILSFHVAILNNYFYFVSDLFANFPAKLKIFLYSSRCFSTSSKLVQSANTNLKS